MTKRRIILVVAVLALFAPFSAHALFGPCLFGPVYGIIAIIFALPAIYSLKFWRDKRPWKSFTKDEREKQMLPWFLLAINALFWWVIIAEGCSFGDLNIFDW